MDKLNSFHQSIKFTVEEEIDQKITYLDLLLIKDDSGNIKYKWHSKATSSNKLLNFLSSHPYHQKYNTAFNFLNRALKLTLSDFHNETIQTVKNLLIENSYPKKLVKKIIHRAINRQNLSNNNPDHSNFQNSSTNPNQLIQNSQNLSNNQNQIQYKSLKYIKTCSDNISKIIKPKLNNIKIAFQPLNKLGTNIMKNLKDKIDISHKNNLIYKIPCAGSSNQNCNLCYVGQTKNKLNKRIKQHIYDLKSKVGQDNTTALVKHYEKDGHSPDFSNVKILDYEQNLSKRLTIESLYILSNNTYNQRRETENISNTYCALFKQNNHPT